MCTFLPFASVNLLLLGLISLPRTCSAATIEKYDPVSITTFIALLFNFAANVGRPSPKLRIFTGGFNRWPIFIGPRWRFPRFVFSPGRSVGLGNYGSDVQPY